MPFKVENGIADFAMILDRFSGHTGVELLNAVEENGGELFLIPGGCTSIVQPLDCTIMFAFKCRIRQQWKQWKIEHTDHLGHCERITRSEFVVIVSRAWAGISPDAVRRSWEAAGLAIQPDQHRQDLMEVGMEEDEDLQFLEEIPNEA